MNPKYFEIRSSQLRSFENFGRGSVKIQKIKDKIIKHRAQISKKREANSSQRSIQNARHIQASVQFKT